MKRSVCYAITISWAFGCAIGAATFVNVHDYPAAVFFGLLCIVFGMQSAAVMLSSWA